VIVPQLNVVDVSPVRTMWGRAWRPKREPLVLPPSEEGWRQGNLFWDRTVTEHTKPPVGTTPPYEAELRSADEDLRHLITTQCCGYHANGGLDFAHKRTPSELPTVAQELAQLGLPSAQSSSDDDDDTSFDVADRNGELFGAAPAWIIKKPSPAINRLAGVAETNTEPVHLGSRQMTALSTRIAWERFAYHCGPVQRYWLTFVDGNLTAASTERSIEPAMVQRLASIAGLLDGRDLEDFKSDNWFARGHYRAIGSFLYGVMKGKHPIASIPSTRRWQVAEDTEVGPRELGLDALDADSEPTEGALWPVSIEEIIDTLSKGLRLSPIERRWLERPSNALYVRTIKRLGFEF
jgi:hypothetical protein